MSLDEYISDESSPESAGGSTERAKEVSEKFKEQVKKASSWIKRTKKDESKAKKQDMLLAYFLVQLILNKKYDNILELLFKLLDRWYPSNFLLWIISLIYIDISNKIREISNKELVDFKYKNLLIEKEFDDKNIDEEIKKRINSWVEDTILASTIDYSSLITSRLIETIQKKDQEVVNFISTVFAFFLKEINITIKKSEADNISSFILWEILSKIKKLNIEKI